MTGEFIEVLGQRGFAGDRGRSKVKALCKTYQSICEAEELRKSRDRSKHKLVSREERVLGGLRRFCKSYRDSFDLEEELVALAMVFKEDLNFTRKLIMLLKNLTSIPDDLVLVSLKALRVLLEDDELSDAGRIAMQVRYHLYPPHVSPCLPMSPSLSLLAPRCSSLSLSVSLCPSFLSRTLTLG